MPEGTAGAWTGIMVRLGRGVEEIASPPSPKGMWTDHAFRFGRIRHCPGRAGFFTVEPEIFLDSEISFRFKDS
jgi:hypothetical protein